MKKIICAAIAAITALTAVPTAFAANNNITVTVDGKEVNFTDQQPVNINGRVMVPVRNVAEAMGWEVDWFEYYGNTVVNGYFQLEHDVILRKTVEKSEYWRAGYQSNINMEHQTRQSTIDGYPPISTGEVPVTVPIKNINGRTLFGIRDIAECTYSDITWDSTTNTVAIKTKAVENFPSYNVVQKFIETSKEMDAERENEKIKTAQQKAEEEKAAEEQKQAEETAREGYTEEVIRLVNEERAKVGAAPLEMDKTLMRAAAVRAEEIKSLYEHTRPNGEKFSTVIKEIDKNYTKTYLGENISVRWLTPESAMNSWMHSEGHRENILRSEFKYIGVGYYYDEDSEDENYRVQIFSN